MFEELADMAQAVTEESATSALEETQETSVNAESETATGESEVDAQGETTETSGSAPDLDKRTKELIRQRQQRREAEKRAAEAEAQAAYYKGLAEGRGGKPAQEAKPTDEFVAPVKPDISQFMDEEGLVDFDLFETAKEQYTLDMAEYRAYSRIQQERAKEEQARMQQAEAVKRAEASKVFIAKAQEMAKTDPEILDFIENPDFLGDEAHPYAEAIAASIVQSTPAMLRYLHDNPAAVKELYAAPNRDALIRTFGKLEAKVEALKPAPTRKVSTAPSPLKTVLSGGGEIDKPLSEITSMEEYAARRKASGRYK